jgi:anti-sigma B factor antagonist
MRMRLRAPRSTVSPLVLPEIVVFPAEVDVSNAALFGVELLAALRPGGAIVIADMTLTAFCDSSGIRHLLIANHRAKKSVAQLRVVVTADAVRRVLHVTGVDQVLDIYPSLQEALTGNLHSSGLVD